MRALALVVALAGIAHAETRPRYGGTVEASLLGAPATFDPAVGQSHAELTVADLVFDTLYRVTPAGHVQPHLATTLPALDGAKTTLRIQIRKGVRFHDGSELGAADVAASLERLRTTSATRWILAPVAAVKVEAPDEIALVLRAPTPDLALQLALPQSAITKAGKPPGERPIGSGPFVVDKLDRAGRRLALRAFDDHFAGRPYLDHLVLRWYDTPDGEAKQFELGRTQLSARGVAAFAGAQPTYRALDVEGPAALLVFVGFGRAHPDVTNERGFRRALDLALARGALTTVTRGERVVPARVPVPVEAGGPALSAAARAGDLDAARGALADAARRVPALAPARLAALRLEILVEETRPDDREIAERVVRALDKLGIASTITAVSGVVLRDRVARGATDLWIGQTAAPVVRQTAWWNAAFAAGGDDWAASQLRTGAIDPAAAQREFAARLPVVPLMFRAVRVWHRTDVRGLKLDALGRACFADVFLFGAPARGRP